MVLDGRLGAGPISWGVCEVPGWGGCSPPTGCSARCDRSASTATELGAPGFLPARPRGATRDARPLTHDAHRRLRTGGAPRAGAARGNARRSVDRTAELFAAAGADGVRAPPSSSTQRWCAAVHPCRAASGTTRSACSVSSTTVCARHGLVHAVHPHAGTLVEHRRRGRAPCSNARRRAVVPRHRPPRPRRLRPGRVRPAPRASASPTSTSRTSDADVAAALASGDVDVPRGDRRRELFRAARRRATRRSPTPSTLLETQRLPGLVRARAGHRPRRRQPPPAASGPVLDVRTSVEYLRSVSPANPSADRTAAPNATGDAPPKGGNHEETLRFAGILAVATLVCAASADDDDDDAVARTRASARSAGRRDPGDVAGDAAARRHRRPPQGGDVTHRGRHPRPGLGPVLVGVAERASTTPPR